MDEDIPPAIYMKDTKAEKLVYGILNPVKETNHVTQSMALVEI